VSGGETKLQVAKRELRSAVEQLAPDAAFNIVTFGDRANAWRDTLAPATKANKEAFFKHVDSIAIAGATNVWAGLELALRIKTIEQNARYATPADEIFVLSDGRPTTGEIVRPEQILETLCETNRTSRIRINTIYIETVREGGGGAAAAGAVAPAVAAGAPRLGPRRHVGRGADEAGRRAQRRLVPAAAADQVSRARPRGALPSPSATVRDDDRGACRQNPPRFGTRRRRSRRPT
jgi:hypothetical protein